jgi:hypothetical protein
MKAEDKKNPRPWQRFRGRIGNEDGPVRVFPEIFKEEIRSQKDRSRPGMSPGAALAYDNQMLILVY